MNKVCYSIAATIPIQKLIYTTIIHIIRNIQKNQPAHRGRGQAERQRPADKKVRPDISEYTKHCAVTSSLENNQTTIESISDTSHTHQTHQKAKCEK